MTRRLTTRLGQLLVDDGLLSESDLGQALEKQQQSGERLGALLVNEGYIEEGKLLSALETQYGVPAAALDDVSIDPALAKLLPREMAERSLMVPLARRNDAIDVAMVDPTDFVAMAHIRFATGLRPNVFITTVNGVRRTIARLYGEAAAAEPTSPPAPDARTDIKRMILDRDRLLMAADEDPRKFYQAAATIDAFVDEIMRKAKSSSD